MIIIMILFVLSACTRSPAPARSLILRPTVILLVVINIGKAMVG